MKERRASQKLSSKSIMDPNQNVKCKIVVVGDTQCGKTALLHVFAKDCFPEVRRGFLVSSEKRKTLSRAAGGGGLERSLLISADFQGDLLKAVEALFRERPFSQERRRSALKSP